MKSLNEKLRIRKILEIRKSLEAEKNLEGESREITGLYYLLFNYKECNLNIILN